MTIASDGEVSSHAVCLASVEITERKKEGAVLALLLRKQQPEPGIDMICGAGIQQGRRAWREAERESERCTCPLPRFSHSSEIYIPLVTELKSTSRGKVLLSIKG